MKKLKTSLFVITLLSLMATAMFVSCNNDDDDDTTPSTFKLGDTEYKFNPSLYLYQDHSNTEGDIAYAYMMFSSEGLSINIDKTSHQPAMGGTGHAFLVYMSIPNSTTDMTHTYTLHQQGGNTKAWNFVLEGVYAENIVLGDVNAAPKYLLSMESGSLTMNKIGEDKYEVKVSGVLVKKTQDGQQERLPFSGYYNGKVINEKIEMGS